MCEPKDRARVPLVCIVFWLLLTINAAHSQREKSIKCGRRWSRLLQRLAGQGHSRFLQAVLKLAFTTPYVLSTNLNIEDLKFELTFYTKDIQSKLLECPPFNLRFTPKFPELPETCYAAIICFPHIPFGPINWRSVKTKCCSISAVQSRSFMQFTTGCFPSTDALCLKNVALFIEPDVVQYKDKSTLRCTYDLEDDVLYSVKWYRGSREFYRYIPAEQPSIKFFPIPGVTADLAKSNSSQVVLKDIEFNLAGNFSCEVTTDGQNIHTRIDSKSMLVVQLPVHPPEISVGRDPLDYGDILRANCSSYPSRPPADLKFILNNITVNQSAPAALRKQNTNDWSDLQLELKLSFIHFNEGRLVLQCVAQASPIYREVAELELESLRHPVPARVRAPSNAAAETHGIERTVRLAVSLLFPLVLGRCRY